MKKEKKGNFLPVVLMPLVVISLVLCFLSGISNITQGQSQEDKRRLEDAVHRAAVACYSMEGFFPPDLSYLEEHYGIQINRRQYVVSYVPVAENLMPDITVMEK